MAVQAQLYPDSLGLTPMCGLQDWMLVHNPPASGLDSDFSFNLQDHNSLLQKPFSQHPYSYPFAFDSNRSLSCSSSITCDSSLLPMSLSQSLHAHLELQRQEVDCIVQLQHERLRAVLQEQRKQQVAMLLRSVESKALPLMKQKEEDLTLARKKSLELEAKLKRAQIESETWQRISRESESMVVDLSNTLEHVRERLALVTNPCEDAESCCGEEDDSQEEEEKENNTNTKGSSSSLSSPPMACKICNSWSACVLFLPCRHLCSCKSCEPFLASCPVCKSVKGSSMEVFWV